MQLRLEPIIAQPDVRVHRAEFAAKLGVVVEEADETVYWLELLAEAEIVSPARLEAITVEARELTAIFTAARQSARQR